MMKKRPTEEMQEEVEPEFYAGRKKEYNLDIFGFNFSELNTSMRYGIGFCLIGCVFGVVLYALKKIAEFNRKDPKKKNKNK
jgi:hypothetical protein